MKYFFHDVIQFIFFIIAMTILGVSFVVYAMWVLMSVIYQRIVGDK